MLDDDYVLNLRRNRSCANRSMRHVRSFLGNARAVDIGSERVAAYVRHRMEQHAAPSTIRNELAALKRAFNLALRTGRINVKPYFPCIRVHNTRTGFFEPHEFDAILQHLDEDVRPVVTFMYLTGWRRREVTKLSWKQVDFTAGTVRLEPGTTKNDEGRIFPINALPPLARLLRDQRRRTSEIELATTQVIPWVFHRAGAEIRSFRHGETSCETPDAAEYIGKNWARAVAKSFPSPAAQESARKPPRTRC